jgi:hypothetical protein
MTDAILDQVFDAILSVLKNKARDPYVIRYKYHRLAIVAKTGDYLITTV